jgi:septum site-determining protein MinC
MSLPAQAAPPASPLAVRSEDGVPVLEIPTDLPLEALRDHLDAHLPDHAEALGGRSVRLDLGDRPIALFDLRRLIHHLEDTHEVAVTGLYAAADAIWRFAERELKLKLFVRDAADPASEDAADDGEDTVDDVDAEDGPGETVPVRLDPDGLTDARKEAPTPEADEPATEAPDAFEDPAAPAEDPGRRTLTVHRTVRSGSAVRFDGDVTVFGDVNPGAQVTAAGSVVVLGALKGVVHAGATGAEDAFILALSLRATQLRIGRRIAIPPEEPSEGPEIAIVRDGRIVIEPYVSKLPVRGS